MLLLGLLLGGSVHVLISRDAILRWLRHDSLKSVSISSALGVPVPLCSCSVVPVVAEMRRKGASRSACMSFLITAPETGADSIPVANAFFGFIPAVMRPFISFITAVCAGILCIGHIRDGQAETAAGGPHSNSGCCRSNGSGSGGHQPLITGQNDCCVSPIQVREAAAHWLNRITIAASARMRPSWFKPEFHHADPAARRRRAAPAPELPSFSAIVTHMFRYGFVEMADDILFSLLVGIALGGVLFLAIPDDLMANGHARWLSYPAVILVGMPLYICASASTPIAAAMVAKGFSPGAALIFLMTGPATNAGTIAIVMNQFGSRFVSIYVGNVIAVTLIFGILIDIPILATGYSLTVNLQASTNPPVQFMQWAGALILFALIFWRFKAGARKGGWQQMQQNILPLFRICSQPRRRSQRSR